MEQRRVSVVERAVAHAATALTRAALLYRLQRNALTDRLTGVANRRAFDAALEQELAAAARDDTTLAVIVIDLDHFKGVNDTWGHAAGDEVLRAVGAALRNSVRAGDHAARYGGEEFAVVLPGAIRADAAATARRVLAAVRAITEPRPMTASLGISCLAEHGRSATELLAAADRALYAAKAGGRDQARVAGDRGPLREQDSAEAAESGSATG